MKQISVGFKSDGISLDGVLAIPEQPIGSSPAVVVCHPHPILGGDMDNPIVTAICRALDRCGLASLRFNFRGVGRSEGEFTNGLNEQSDLLAAVETLSLWPGIDGERVGLAGYSFGATVVLQGIAQYSSVRCLAFIAPPLKTLKGSNLALDARPMLFVSGENDRIAPPVEIQKTLEIMKVAAKFFQVPEANHSLRKTETITGDEVARFMASELGECG